jgi:hypothetical protein
MAQDLFVDRTALSAGGYVGLTFRLALAARALAGHALRDLPRAERAEARAEPAPDGPLPRERRRLAQGHVGRFSQLPASPAHPRLRRLRPRRRTARSGRTRAPWAWRRRSVGGFALDATAFYQRLRTSDLESIFNYDPTNPRILEVREGESYGFELLIRREISRRLYGWLAYTLSWSDRLVGYYQVKSPSDWDQRHIFNLVAGYRMRAGGRPAAAIHFNTGPPYPVFDDRVFNVDYQRPAAVLPARRAARQTLRLRSLRAIGVCRAREQHAHSRGLRSQAQAGRDGRTKKGFRIVLPSLGVHAEW